MIKTATTEPLVASFQINDNNDSFYEYVVNKKHISYTFDKFEIGVVLDDNNKFLGIDSIKISKSFVDTGRISGGQSAEEMIDQFLEEQDE